MNNLEKCTPFLFSTVFIVSYLFFYPEIILSIDELSYLSRGMAFANGYLDLIQTTLFGSSFSWAPDPYPLGNSFLQSFFYRISNSVVFLSGPIYLLGALYFTIKSLRILDSFHYLSIILFFLFPPMLFFSRGLMSEMPSLLLVSIALWVLVSRKDTFGKYLTLGIIGGLSLWFREVNGLIIGLLVLIPMLKKMSWVLAGTIGGLLGLVPRMFSSWLVYGDAMMIKQSGQFGFEYFFGNAPLYLFLATILIPGGLFFINRYRPSKGIDLRIPILGFLVLHLFYSYNSGNHSGKIVSLFYNGRFFIPTIPLWCAVLGQYLNKNNMFKNKNFIISSQVLAVLFFLSFHFVLNKLTRDHYLVGQEIYSKYQDKNLIYDDTAYRYVNPIYGQYGAIAGVEEVLRQSGNNIDSGIYILSGKFNTASQDKAWDGRTHRIEKLKKWFDVKIMEQFEVFDGTKIYVYNLVSKV